MTGTPGATRSTASASRGSVANEGIGSDGALGAAPGTRWIATASIGGGSATSASMKSDAETPPAGGALVSMCARLKPITSD